MEIPHVRVPRSEGESVRKDLAAADVIDRNFRITECDGWLYIPIDTESPFSHDFDIVSRAGEPRDRQHMPKELVDFPASYERLGDIVLIDEEDSNRAQELAKAVMDSSLPVKTVLNRKSKIAGEYRVREWELLAGTETETIHREFGAEFLVDVTKTYFSPRLATERHRVTAQVEPGEHVVDMFAGVGPFAIPMALRGATVVAIDLNPAAICYLKENARRNDVAEQITAREGDVRKIATEYANWADRLVMNLPHRANEFLDVARELAGTACRLHYYDIQSDNDPFAPGEAAIQEAFERAYAVNVVQRQIVRSYAPHEVNVCLDVDVVRH